MAEAVVISNSSEEDKEIQHELDGKQPNGAESLPLSDRNSPNHATNDKTHEALDQLRNVKTNDDDDYYAGLLEEAAEKYVYFWKSGSVFSQWHMSNFEVDSKKFHCAEQYMMYEKAMLFNDHEIAQLILKSKSPREIKKLGREVRGFVDEIWKYKCLDIVKKANVTKFSCNKKLLREMVKTYPKTLVEASPYDSIWGIQLEESDPAAWSESTWLGTNYLGYILTEVRNDLMIKIGDLTEDQRLNFVKEEQKKYEEAYKMLTSSLKSSQAHESTTNSEKSSSKKNSVSGRNQPKKDNENNEDRSESAKRSGKVTDGKSTKKEEANERNEEPSQTDDQTGGKKKKKKKKKKKGGDKDSPGNAMVTIQDFELPSSYSSSSKDDEANPRNEPKDENVKKSNKKTDEKPCDVSDVSIGFDDVGSQANNEVNPPAPNRVKNGQVNPPALNEVRNGQVNPPALNEVKNGQENDEAPVAKVSRRQKRNAKRHSKQNN